MHLCASETVEKHMYDTSIAEAQLWHLTHQKTEKGLLHVSADYALQTLRNYVCIRATQYCCMTLHTIKSYIYIYLHIFSFAEFCSYKPESILLEGRCFFSGESEMITTLIASCRKKQ